MYKKLLNYFKRILGYGSSDDVKNVIEEIISYGNAKGSYNDYNVSNLLPEEVFIIKNSLKLSEKNAEDIMIPRSEIKAVEVNSSVLQLVEFIFENNHSRIPIFNETLDNPLGMVHIKDIFENFYNHKDNINSLNIRKVIRPVLYVPTMMKVIELLAEMRSTNSHIALVVDEYGGVDGLITMEDVLEELVGEIEDEHDVKDASNDFIINPDDSYSISAKMSIEQLEKILGISFDEEKNEVDTVAGLILLLNPNIPVTGELIVHPKGVEFEVIEANIQAVIRLNVRKSLTYLE